MKRHYCSRCGHGYGVHQPVQTPLIIEGGVVEFAEAFDAERVTCTGYPDMMKRDGRRCPCRRFEES